jgi:hypothetical protein
MFKKQLLKNINWKDNVGEYASGKSCYKGNCPKYLLIEEELYSECNVKEIEEILGLKVLASDCIEGLEVK